MREIVSKRRYEMSTARCVIINKIAVLLSIIYMIRLNRITLLTTSVFRASKISLCAHRRYDVTQTTPLEQPVNTASSAYLSELHFDVNYHARPLDPII
jgi:hypothetical protein